jgi:DNA-binding LytR/AlgR family response regulator
MKSAIEARRSLTNYRPTQSTSKMAEGRPDTRGVAIWRGAARRLDCRKGFFARHFSPDDAWKAAVTATAPPADPRDASFRVAAFRVLLMCLAVALIIGVSGVAKTFEQEAEWVAESLLGAGCGLAAARWLTPPSWFHKRLWAAALLIAAVVTIPVAAVVLGCRALLHGAVISPAIVIDVAPSVFATSLVMTALAFLVRRAPTQTHAAQAGAPPPKFLARLPPKLQGADLYAVEAEDHYLRLHTSLGQDLILMRLADAIVELEGLEGAQTHRSWWVARGAVATAERFDGRAVLTLKDGAEAPVSRGFARGLRAAGWF